MEVLVCIVLAIIVGITMIVVVTREVKKEKKEWRDGKS